MEQTLKVIEINGHIVLKNGRKKYAQISLNSNPDYKWVIYFQGGMALSGYKTKELAIARAMKMFEDWKNVMV
jgi:ABC-type molybdenum transport system ATPase subunit/photorepair protein PhrA